MSTVATELAEEVIDDTAFNVRKWTMHILGKGGIKTGAAPAIAQALGVAGDMGALVIGVPMAAAFSSALVQGEYLHKRDSLRRQYSREVGAKLGKEPSKVTFADVHLAAFGDNRRGIEGNKALEEAITESKKRRNWGVLISVVASSLSALGVFGLAGMDGSFIEHAIHQGGFTGALAAGATGLALYAPTSLALHWSAENLFGVEKETVNDKVNEIRRARANGKTVTQEKVMEAYIEAHPDLNKNIEASYGHHFHALNRDEKIHLLKALGPELGLERITEDLNLGKMRPEELAFAVYGQSSGYQHEEMAQLQEPKKDVLSQSLHTAKNFMRSMFGMKTEGDKAMEKAEQVQAVSANHGPQSNSFSYASHDGSENLVVSSYQDEQQGQKTSFVSMVGNKRSKDGKMTFVEQVEQSRSGPEVTIN